MSDVLGRLVAAFGATSEDAPSETGVAAPDPRDRSDPVRRRKRRERRRHADPAVSDVAPTVAGRGGLTVGTGRGEDDYDEYDDVRSGDGDARRGGRGSPVSPRPEECLPRGTARDRAGAEEADPFQTRLETIVPAPPRTTTPEEEDVAPLLVPSTAPVPTRIPSTSQDLFSALAVEDRDLDPSRFIGADHDATHDGALQVTNAGDGEDLPSAGTTEDHLRRWERARKFGSGHRNLGPAGGYEAYLNVLFTADRASTVSSADGAGAHQQERIVDDAAGKRSSCVVVLVVQF